MLDTMVTNHKAVVNHTAEEIKASNAKLRARHLRQLNHALSNVNEATDPEWRNICNNTYQTLLAVVHVNGQGGSLLIEEEYEAPYMAGFAGNGYGL